MTTTDNIEIVPYKVQNKEDYGCREETRYQVIDLETGEVLDNAQGYGYKSYSKARAAWNWKQKKDYPAGQKKAGKWLAQHKEILSFFENEEVWKRKDPANDGVTKRLCEQVIVESKEDTDFSPSDLLKAWQKGLYEKKQRDAHVRYNNRHKQSV